MTTSVVSPHSMLRTPPPASARNASRRLLSIVCWIYFLAATGLLEYLHGERGVALPLAIGAVAIGVIAIAVFAVLWLRLSAAIDRIRSLETRRDKHSHN